jgi:hypothetical protein
MVAPITVLAREGPAAGAGRETGFADAGVLGEEGF